jgi:hypothetical protein
MFYSYELLILPVTPRQFKNINCGQHVLPNNASSSRLASRCPAIVQALYAGFSYTFPAFSSLFSVTISIQSTDGEMY